MSRIDLVALAHETVTQVLHAGDIAVDATVGNGHDTLFLAQTVGATGHVYGFDIQHSAIAASRQRLEQKGIAPQVTFMESGHEEMVTRIPQEHRGHIKAVMFNLGYLPGADKSVTTSPDTTLQALIASCSLLAPGGIITVLAYTGHFGGRQEAEAIKQWAHHLDSRHYSITVTIPEARNSTPPELIIIRDRRLLQV